MGSRWGCHFPRVSKQRLCLLSLVRRAMGRRNQGALFCQEEVWTVPWARGADPGQASPVSLPTWKSVPGSSQRPLLRSPQNVP